MKKGLHDDGIMEKDMHGTLKDMHNESSKKKDMHDEGSNERDMHEKSE